MDKVLLVTGASSEVGVALIKKVYDDYSFILAHYNSNIGQIEELRKLYGDKIIPIKCNFQSEDNIESMITTIKEMNMIPDHIVHLSSPKIHHEYFQKRKWKEYQDGIDISLQSAVCLLNAFLPVMKKKKYGKIVFMLTSYVSGTAPKFQSAYITVKYALYGLMRSLAAEFADKGITVNAISPDMMETKFLSDMPDVVVRMNADKNPLKRNIRVDDVIPTLSYLLSDDSDTVTGQNIAITAGSELM